MKNLLKTRAMQEKKIGRGEDSDPILLDIDNAVVIGVFDGMGGAGSSECSSDFGEDKTNAYVGSRIVRDVIEAHIKNNIESVSSPGLVEIIRSVIKERYAEEKEKYPPKIKGNLRSSLIKEYPTTMAILTLRDNEDKYLIDSYWAGDSRNYIWGKDGLFQVTHDDLKGNVDPLQNIYEDAPLSNCIHADGSFEIHHQSICCFKKSDKFLLISATDGCFGYYPSPMDFEQALIDTLHESSDISEWENFLSEEFSAVAADDFSFAIVAVGFKNFREVKDLHKKTELIRAYSERRRSYKGKIRKKIQLEEQIAKLDKELKAEIEELWPRYKSRYLKLMQDE